MGNTYVNNTIELLEAITEDTKHKHNPQTDKKCYKCFCVPNYIEILGGEYCDVKSPKSKSKPRKLIRNTNQFKHTPSSQSNDTKSYFLPIPAPIQIEESYCSDVSSLDLGIATIELPNNNPNINDNNSYSTVEINNSFEYDEENESIISIENINAEMSHKIQNDIIKHNSLHKYLDQMSESDNDEDIVFCKYSDREKSSVDNLTDIITSIEPYHMHEEGIESETEWVKNLKMELKYEPDVYLKKRRKHKGKRRKIQKKVKKVNSMY